MTSIRLHQLLLAAAVVVPAVLFAAAAWQNHEDVLREGRDAIGRTAIVMQEHARKVFETAELAIGQIDERIDEQNDATAHSPAMNAFLRRLKAPMDQLVSLWVADPDGSIAAGSQDWDPATGIAARDFFQAQKTADQGTYVGQPFTGRATSTPSFAIIRRRTTHDGHFAGTIHAATSPAYFARFYAEVSPPFEHTAMLLRTDGAILAREPPQPDQHRIERNTPLMRRVAPAGPQSTQPGTAGGVLFDVDGNGEGHDYAVRHVGFYPIAVVFSVPHRVLLTRWYRNIRIYGAVAAVAALTLLAVSWLALRRATSEQRALERLQTESAQRQAAEAQLRHAQRMDAVGQLTGGVAHDFNNLLTAVLGNLELIQRAAATPDGAAKITRLAGTAMKAVQRGAALTKSLLAFSRKQPLQPRPVQVNALVDEYIDLVRQAVGVAVQVAFEPSADLPPCIADPAELQGALLNLAINARDAMPNGGRLWIRTAATRLEAAALSGNPEARPGAFVSIEVADTGVGMPPEVMAKAFEPFFTTKPIGQGTGLGLSQVFGFVRQSGGHVEIESRPGAGTTIRLHLPVA